MAKKRTKSKAKPKRRPAAKRAKTAKRAVRKKKTAKRARVTRAASKKAVKRTSRPKSRRNKPAARSKSPRRAAKRTAPAAKRKAHARRVPRPRIAGRVAMVDDGGYGPDSGGQSGDIQGLSRSEVADSESVEELVEEGQAFEAGIVEAVEDAPEGEIHTREVPEDDVPEEYLDED